MENLDGQTSSAISSAISSIIEEGQGRSNRICRLPCDYPDDASVSIDDNDMDLDYRDLVYSVQHVVALRIAYTKKWPTRTLTQMSL